MSVGLYRYHSYVMNCMMCHAHDISDCIVPSVTVVFLEDTNAPPNVVGGMMTPPQVAANRYLRNNNRTMLLMADGHTERLN